MLPPPCCRAAGGCWRPGLRVPQELRPHGRLLRYAPLAPCGTPAVHPPLHLHCAAILPPIALVQCAFLGLGRAAFCWRASWQLLGQQFCVPPLGCLPPSERRAGAAGSPTLPRRPSWRSFSNSMLLLLLLRGPADCDWCAMPALDWCAVPALDHVCHACAGCRRGRPADCD